MRPCLALLALLLLPRLCRAYDLWLESSADGLILRYGHRDGERLTIDAGKVKAIRCLEQGATSDRRAAAALMAHEVTIPGHCDVASVFYDGGFYSTTPDGEVDLPRSAAGDAVRACRSTQFAKWMDSRSGRAGTVLGDEFEIVPVTDLARVREGDRVSLRVLLNGSPVSGAIVSIDHKALGESDSAGEARLRIRTADVESISASLRRPLSTPEADTAVLEARLTFVIAQ